MLCDHDLLDPRAVASQLEALIGCVETVAPAIEASLRSRGGTFVRDCQVYPVSEGTLGCTAVVDTVVTGEERTIDVTLPAK